MSHDTLVTVAARPNGYSSPDTALDPFTSLGASGAWTQIDIANGNFQDSSAPATCRTISLNFAGFAHPDRIQSVHLKFSIQVAGSITASVCINYGSGWTLLQQYTSGLTAADIVLNVDDPGNISIGLIYDGTLASAAFSNLNLEYVYSSIDFKPKTVNFIANELIEEYGDRVQSLKIVRVVERWIDEIYKKIINYCPWNFAHQEEPIITEADESTYTVNGPVNNATSLRFTDGSGPIRFRPRDVIVRSGYNIDQTGKPIWFYHQGFDEGAPRIVLVPTPDSAYSLMLFGNPIPVHLLSDDVIPLPSSFISALKDGVRYYYSQRRGHPEDAQVHIGNFYNQLRDLAHEYKKLPASDDGLEDWSTSSQRPNPMGEWFPGGGF